METISILVTCVFLSVTITLGIIIGALWLSKKEIDRYLKR